MGINLNELEQEYNELNSLETLNQDQQDRKNWLENKIGEYRATQQEREQQIEEKVIGDEITFNVPGVDFKELPAELITLIDRVVRADRRRIYAEENAKFDQVTSDHRDAIRASADRELQAVRQNDALQQRFRVIEIERDDAILRNGELHEHATRIDQENDDLQQRLKNATDMIEEKQREVERLESEIQDMRAAANFGEKQAQKIIDVTPQETADMQDLVNNIAKKYVSITPIAANWHEAIAEDGSKTVVHTKDLPSLETQGSQFRGNDQAGNQETVLPSVNQEATFPSAPNVATVHAPDLATGNVSGESTHEQVEEKTDTRSEIEQRVEILEQSNLEMQTWIDSIEKRVGKMDGLDSYNDDEVA